MERAVSTTSVIRSNCIPSRPFTVRLRSKQWLLSWCRCRFEPLIKYKTKSTAFLQCFSCGSPNWESEAKITECCFCRSDVSRCEQYELSLLNEIVRHISRRALSGTSDRLRSKHHLVSSGSWSKRKSSSFQNCFMAPRTGLEPVTSWLTVMRYTDWAIEE